MSVENEKEIQQLKNRIRELADKSYNQNQYTFTGFLGLAEQDALWQVEREVKFAGFSHLLYPDPASVGKICRQAVPQGLSGGADEPWH